MRYHFKIHKEGDGYWAQGIELSSCFTEADSFEELLSKLYETLNLYLVDPRGDQKLPPIPDDSIKTRGKSIVAIKVDPKIAFSILVRYEREKMGITQKKAQKIMKAKNIFSYQRLETPRDATLSTVDKVLDIYPEFPINLIFS